MNASIKYILSDKIMLLGFSCAALLSTFHGILVVLLYRAFPPFVPVFNQMPWGIERLGGKEQLFTPLIIAVFILVGNIFFSSFIYQKMPLVARIVCVTSMLVSLFALLFFVRLMQIIL